jgi:uncharacterized protein YgiM (DUF1202 family)
MKTSCRRKYISLIAVAGSVIVLVTSLAATARAQVILTTGAELTVHSGPSPNSRRLDTLPEGQKVTLLLPRGRRDYFKIRYNDNKTGWANGDYLLVPDVEALDTSDTNLLTMRAAMQPCGLAVHYRWKQKTTTSRFAANPPTASVHAALNWPAAPFKGHGISSWCKDRVGRELNSFSVAGFVRRTRTETDGDVHIEITQRASDEVTDCLVVEIPSADLSPRFNTARNELARLLSVTAITNKDFETPVKVRFSGLAFWDGWHAGTGLPSGHGRCNSTPGAAWELHPVYKVSSP